MESGGSFIPVEVQILFAIIIVGIVIWRVGREGILSRFKSSDGSSPINKGTLPAIYAIQVPDAPQYTGKLREILQRLKTESRIGNFFVMNPGEGLSSLPGTLKKEDMVLIVLTNGFEGQKKQVEHQFREMKASRGDVKIAEILVDNVVYDNAFITFPADLKPLCDREDTGVAWSSIEREMKELFPIKQAETKPLPAPVNWEKYMKIAGIIIAILIVFFILRELMGGEREPASPGYQPSSGIVSGTQGDEIYEESPVM